MTDLEQALRQMYDEYWHYPRKFKESSHRQRSIGEIRRHFAEANRSRFLELERQVLALEGGSGLEEKRLLGALGACMWDSLSSDAEYLKSLRRLIHIEWPNDCAVDTLLHAIDTIMVRLDADQELLADILSVANSGIGERRGRTRIGVALMAYFENVESKGNAISSTLQAELTRFLGMSRSDEKPLAPAEVIRILQDESH